MDVLNAGPEPGLSFWLDGGDGHLQATIEIHVERQSAGLADNAHQHSPCKQATNSLLLVLGEPEEGEDIRRLQELDDASGLRKCSPCFPRRSPLAARRSPLAARRSPLAARRSPPLAAARLASYSSGWQLLHGHPGFFVDPHSH
ncbi:MAG: hypothetical protein ACYCW6_00225 [Candidatus Xenobia bacterium]